MGAHACRLPWIPHQRRAEYKGSEFEGNAMSDFLARMKSAAKADKKTIVLPEGEDTAHHRGCQEDASRRAWPTSSSWATPMTSPQTAATWRSPASSTPAPPRRSEAYAEKFAELRAKKGVTLARGPRADERRQPYFGTMMVKMGDADGLVSGACHSTGDVLRPSPADPEDRPGRASWSAAFFIMVVPNCEFGARRHFPLLPTAAWKMQPDADKLCRRSP